MLDEIIVAKKQNEGLSKKSGIYMIQNLINGKMYIGSSYNIFKRVSRHRTELKHNKHCNEYLQRSYNKYGLNNFIFLELEFCEKSELLTREQVYLDKYMSYEKENGYNILKSAVPDLDRFPKILKDKFSFSHIKNKTHCKNNHEFTEENTIIIKRKDRRDSRKCRACMIENTENRTKRRRELYKQKNKPRELKIHCECGLLLSVYSNGAKHCKPCMSKKYLEKAKNDPKRGTPPGRKRQEFCEKGHKIESTPSGYRLCKVCSRIKQVERRGGYVRSKTHCKNGHLRTKENTYIAPNTRKKRCLSCKQKRKSKIKE